MPCLDFLSDICPGFQIPHFYARFHCLWVIFLGVNSGTTLPQPFDFLGFKPDVEQTYAEIYGTLDLPMLTLRFCRLEHCRTQVQFNLTIDLSPIYYSEPDRPVAKRGRRQFGRSAARRDGAGEAEGQPVTRGREVRNPREEQ